MDRAWRILVVDDEPDVCSITAELLEAMGHQVYATGSGYEAIDHLKQENTPYDLALVDWSMPGVAGRDVVRVIQQRSPSTKVLVTTGTPPRSAGLERIGTHADGVIYKPFSFATLRDHIQRALPPTIGDES